MATRVGLERGQLHRVPSLCLEGSSTLPAESPGTSLLTRAPAQNSQLAPGAQHPWWYAGLQSTWSRWWGRESVSQYHYGDTYHTTNTNTAPVTNIQYANNVNMAGRNIVERLPMHPDLGEEWAEYWQDSRSGDIEKIWAWADDPNGELVFWIHSDPKQGKSTLARQLRGELQSKGRLAAAIFLSLLDSKGLESVVRLIGGEIGLVHRRVAGMVVEAIENCYGASLGPHIEKVVRDPLLILQPPQPLIILIDGVTEWKLHADFIEQLSLLEPFTSFIRFVILGRSEPPEGRYKNVSIRSYELGPVSAECMAGYLNDRFDTIKWKGVGRRPTPEDVLRLAVLASGDFTRMEEVVSIIRDLPISHYDDISKPIFDMALSDGSSFYMPGTGDALERSILLDRIALALRPPGHPERHWSLNNLSACLQQSYQKSQSAGVLEEAISLDREALALRPRGHPDRHYSCYNLTNAVYDRFRRDGRIGDLEEAITLGREALLLLPEGNEHRFAKADNQRLYLYNRFKIKCAVEDLQEAIALAEEALSLCPKDNHSYPVLPGWILSRKKELTEAMGSCSSVSE